MEDLNTVNLIGRVVRDAELKAMNGGNSKADFSVAFTTRKNIGGEWNDESNFVNLTLWGKRAEALAPLLLKGKQVAISGHLHMDTWETEGKKNSALRLIPENVQLLGGAKNGGNNSAPASAPADDFGF